MNLSSGMLYDEIFPYRCEAFISVRSLNFRYRPWDLSFIWKTITPQPSCEHLSNSAIHTFVPRKALYPELWASEDETFDKVQIWLRTFPWEDKLELGQHSLEKDDQLLQTHDLARTRPLSYEERDAPLVKMEFVVWCNKTIWVKGVWLRPVLGIMEDVPQMQRNHCSLGDLVTIKGCVPVKRMDEYYEYGSTLKFSTRWPFQSSKQRKRVYIVNNKWNGQVHLMDVHFCVHTF